MRGSWKFSRQSFDEPASEAVTTAVMAGRWLGDDTHDVARAYNAAERRIRTFLYKDHRPKVLVDEWHQIRRRTSVYLRYCAERARQKAEALERKADELDQLEQQRLEWRASGARSCASGRGAGG